MITVDEIMTVKPFTLTEVNTLGDAHRLMAEEQIRHVPIVDADQSLVGLVSQTDVIAATHSILDGRSTEQLTAEEAQAELGRVMVTEVQTTTPGTSLRQAALLLHVHKYGCLPVLDEGQLVGIVTDSDFVGVAINLLLQQEELSFNSEENDGVGEELEEFDDLDDIYVETDEEDHWSRADL